VAGARAYCSIDIVADQRTVEKHEDGSPRLRTGGGGCQRSSTNRGKEIDMKPQVMAFVLITSLALAACATGGQSGSESNTSQRHVLKDGNTLLVDADGRMRMFAPDGDRVYMKDGVAMELQDGTVITMKENIVWKTLRTRGTFNGHS
jgi:hypothetical protein